nr:uncharacterized protein SPCC1672.14 [Schizosaccharomyces pombe]G2TRU2.1 RecName: Full=Putative uncharacterized transmembrane protein SPCC1672.14 [Schizosaccharomyces pombe 972h-]CCD31392.1 sequence orphan [Schizosaccharomyces pombe]|eukprot:NP_001343182.1 uncharacterized protein SPCC1672.14 [Schizosaccharomyces pombe]
MEESPRVEKEREKRTIRNVKNKKKKVSTYFILIIILWFISLFQLQQCNLHAYSNYYKVIFILILITTLDSLPYSNYNAMIHLLISSNTLPLPPCFTLRASLFPPFITPLTHWNVGFVRLCNLFLSSHFHPLFHLTNSAPGSRQISTSLSNNTQST